MTQEEKELLLKDLCARLPYNPIVYVDENLPRLKLGAATRVWEYIAVDKPCKPYLRPMSSMTKEEENEWCGLNIDPLLEAVNERHTRIEDLMLRAKSQYKPLDWLNAHHFDYRGLIEKGLALEALDGMYN
jgi:hypothetical protein